MGKRGSMRIYKFLSGLAITLVAFTSAPLNADDYKIVWTDTIDNGSIDEAYGVVVDSVDNIIVAGVSHIGNADYYTVKYGPDDNIIWTDTIDNGNWDYGYGVAVDSAGNIIVTGRSVISGNWDYYTVKYSPTSMGVELTSFTGESFNAKVVLKWRTESEIDTYEWVIVRSSERDGGYEEVVRIKSQGSTPYAQEYSYTDTDVTAGITYYYKLGDVDAYGNTTWWGPMMVTVYGVPSTPTELAQNYPNPFNSFTVISYSLPSMNDERKTNNVNLKIYDTSGRLVHTFRVTPCQHSWSSMYSVVWDGRDESGRAVPDGVYFYQLSSGDFRYTSKMILIR